jgi:UDP-N-acetylglucosamine 2-epimerase (non-hydrolysing)
MEQNSQKNQLPVAFIVGTVPEAIKVAPVLDALHAKGYTGYVILTGQHDKRRFPWFIEKYRDDVWDLAGATDTGNLASLRSAIEVALDIIPESSLIKFALVVQGDTSSAYVGAMVAFNDQRWLAHIEAGMRSGRSDSPCPEESYRQCISKLAQIHFCPTKDEKRNLERERVQGDIHITGNTSIDALQRLHITPSRGPTMAHLGAPAIVVTMHRHETSPAVREFVLNALEVRAQRGVKVEWVKHANPAYDVETTFNNKVKFIDPLPHQDFAQKIASAGVIVTDSGGIQEEACYFDKRIIVVRKATERHDPRGTDYRSLIYPDTQFSQNEFEDTLDEYLEAWKQRPADPIDNGLFPQPPNTHFGDGHAGERIAQVLISR